MTVLAVGAFLFTSSMLMNVTYGIMTGIGTIDRLKKKATNTMGQSDEEPIKLEDVFGIAGYHTWPFPIDPVFEDFTNRNKNIKIFNCTAFIEGHIFYLVSLFSGGYN